MNMMERPVSVMAKPLPGKIASRLLAASASIVCFLPVPALAKAEITGLNIFGDSLMDAGNLFNLTGLPPSPPYDQKLSNGKIWVEQVADALDLEPALSTDVLPGLFAGTTLLPTDGINFAFGGSLSSDVNVGSSLLPGLRQQIETFGVLSALAPPDPDALYLLLAGGNDYNEAFFNPAALTVPLDLLPNQVTDNLANAVAALVGAGAKHVLVSNLPDLSLQPFVATLNQANPESAALLSGLSAQHNQLLAQKLTALEATSGADIIELDLNGLFAKAIENPASFGFKNVTESCLTNFQPRFVFDGICENPDEFLFWDNVHPTEAGHGAIAQLALKTIADKDAAEEVPEPAGVLGLMAGAGAIAVMVRRRSLKVA
ncbi:MAG: SGNH/GDSL hydrolase family protein [Phormidesmis sp.]